MATYRLDVSPLARKQFAKLDPQIRRRVGNAIDALASDPRPPGCKLLQGRPGYRVRVGDYRVVYVVNDGALLVLVVQLGHRREVYR